MNAKIVIRVLARLLVVGAALFLVPAFVALLYREYREIGIFLITGGALAVPALICSRLKADEHQLDLREGMVVAALFWLIYAFVGALPFWVSGSIPHLVDAYFESVSGFTTTGATILSEVESLPYSMLFWRSFSHWVGGMGVLVLAIAVLPASSNAMNLMQAECAGPSVGKLVPKGKTTALYLYLIYAALTVVTFILLLFGGMNVFDSLCHAMGTAGTGGFSTHNDGILGFNSPYIEWVLTIMMLAFGINFSLYYALITKHFKELLENTEWKVYFFIIAAASILIKLNTGTSVRTAIFQVASLITSTGFATADFNLWPLFTHTLLLILMAIGACAGSTGGGFKVQRVVILWKGTQSVTRRLLHPNAVTAVHIDKRPVQKDLVHSVMRYLILCIIVLVFSTLIISLWSPDFATAFSAVLTCFNNIGPGLSAVGSMENFGFFSDGAKLLLCANMLLGRLEILPFIVLFSPSVWGRKF